MSDKDPSIFKVHLPIWKLFWRWEANFRQMEQTGPVRFVIWDQMSGRVRISWSGSMGKSQSKKEWEKEKKGNRIR